MIKLTLAALLSACTLSTAAPAEVTIDPLGNAATAPAPVPASKGKKSAGGGNAAAMTFYPELSAQQQALSGGLGDKKKKPILTPDTVLQLPEDCDIRSANLATRRGAVLITDGAIHQKDDRSWLQKWYMKPWRKFPFGYILSPTGELKHLLQFHDRKRQPYGIAEDPNDGRIAISYYQGPTLDVWEPDLKLKYTYHDNSIHPTIPFFDSRPTGQPGMLWQPWDIMDRMHEEGPTIIMLWIYKQGGKRVEVFPRRQFKHVRMPHSMQLDSDGRLWAAGLKAWIWEEGRGRGQWLIKDEYKNESSPVAIEVLTLMTDGSSPEYQEELRARWREQHKDQGHEPKNLAELDRYRFTYVLRSLVKFDFPGLCKWPLLALTGDGHALTACYDGSFLAVLKVAEPVEGGDNSTAAAGFTDLSAEQGNILLPAGRKSPQLRLLQKAEQVLRIERPYGIDRIGALTMDPSGKGFLITDRSRARVYGAPYPIPAKGPIWQGASSGMEGGSVATGGEKEGRNAGAVVGQPSGSVISYKVSITWPLERDT